MAGRWFGRVRRSPQETAAAAAARDGAVAAFLDLDTRQRYVDESVGAVAALDPRSSLIAAWDRVEQQCFAAAAAYVAATERYDLDRSSPVDADPVDLVAAAGAYRQVHTTLADAATAVDGFHERHREQLDRARSAVAATPRIAEEAAAAAAAARRRLQQDAPSPASAWSAGPRPSSARRSPNSTALSRPPRHRGSARRPPGCTLPPPRSNPPCTTPGPSVSAPRPR
jgi:hypothetical protein